MSASTIPANEAAGEKLCKSEFVPTLFVYQHCPFCARARYMAAIKQIPIKIEYLKFDDEKAHTDKVGVKMAPILEYSPGKYMRESTKIVEWFDGPSSGQAPVLKVVPAKDSALSKAINIFQLPPALIAPRLPLLIPPLPELATKEATAYFVDKKQKLIGMSMDEALKQTPKYLKEAREQLAALEPLLSSPQAVHSGGELTLDDVLLFGSLWPHAVVEGLKLPGKLSEFFELGLKRSGLTRLPTYREQAQGKESGSGSGSAQSGAKAGERKAAGQAAKEEDETVPC